MHHILLLIITFFFATQGLARFAKPEEAPTSIVLKRTDYHIRKDGTFTVTHEYLIRIQNEAGRSLSTYRLSYNTRTSTFKLIKAETRSGGKVFAVDPKYIEDKPKASNLFGFDEENQVTIAYPNVDINAEIYLKYELTVKEVPIANAFSEFVVFGENQLEENSQVTFSSELPLKMAQNDPTQSLDVKTLTKGKSVVITAATKRPVYFQALDEDERGFFRLKDKTYIMVSSFASYEDIGKELAKKFEERLSAGLPKEFDSIVTEAAKETDVVNAANKVTSLLSEKIRYMGDWRPVGGGYVSRPLQAIADSHFGDCKDMSTLTVAILRKLGLSAHVAIIWRGKLPNEIHPLPSVQSFNHAVVLLEDREKKYIIDPTNLQSFAQGVPDDLFGRAALVLDPKKPYLYDVPMFTQNDTRHKAEIYFDADDAVTINEELDLSGFAAFPLSGLEKVASKETIMYFAAKTFSGNRKMRKYNFGPFDLTSRLVKDLHFSLHLEIEDAVVKTTAGNAYALDLSPIDSLMTLDGSQQVLSIFLGMPSKHSYEELLKNISMAGEVPKPCNVVSPWFEVLREFHEKDDDLLIRQEFTQKTSVISVEDLHSESFLKAQNALRACVNKFMVVFKK